MSNSAHGGTEMTARVSGSGAGGVTTVGITDSQGPESVLHEQRSILVSNSEDQKGGFNSCRTQVGEAVCREGVFNIMFYLICQALSFFYLMLQIRLTT